MQGAEVACSHCPWFSVVVAVAVVVIQGHSGAALLYASTRAAGWVVGRDRSRPDGTDARREERASHGAMGTFLFR